MPMIAETAAPDVLQTGRAPIAPADRDPFTGGAPEPFGAVFNAAMREQNPIVSVLNAINDRTGDYDPHHNPLDLIKGTKYEAEHLSDFISSPNEQTTRNIMARIDREEEDRKILAKSGWAGTVASLGAGLLDPTMYIPFVDIGASVRSGYGMARTAYRASMLGAMQSSVSEAALMASHHDQTWGDAVGNVASATLLMGLLGGAHAMLFPSERAAAEASLDTMRRDYKVDPRTAGDPVAAADEVPRYGYAQPAPAGAAAADERELIQKRYAPVPNALRDAVPAVDAVGRAIEWANDRLSPMGRLIGGESVEARRAVVDLAETPRVFEENVPRPVLDADGRPVLDREGRPVYTEPQTTTRDGLAPVDRVVKMQEIRGRYETRQVLNDAYVQYRYGGQAPSLRGVREGIETITGRDTNAMSFGEFKEEVAKALYSGDRHEIAEVQRAAQEIRSKVLDPVKKAAQETIGPDGRPLLAEDLDAPKGDQSFFPRMFNKTAIAAKRNKFVGTVTGWLEKDQAEKAAIKERLAALDERKGFYEDRMERVQDRIDRAEIAHMKVDAKAEELSALNQFAYSRSERMTEPLDELRVQIRAIEGKVQPALDQLAELKKAVAAEKANWPEIKEADAAIFKLIAAGQKVKQGKDIVSTLDALADFAAGLDDAKSAISAGIRSASDQAKQARLQLGADALMEIEAQHAALAKKLAPYTRKLRALRRDLRERHAAVSGNAQGGAVFETKIRNRGNQLADRVSGKAHDIETLQIEFARLKAEHERVLERIEAEIQTWHGNTTAEAKSALGARKAAEDARAESIAAGTYEGSGERMTSADGAVDRAMRSILGSDRDLSRAEIEARANEITDRILGSPDGRLPYNEPSAHDDRVAPGGGQEVRGSLNGRTFAIPTAEIAEFVEHDVEHAVHGLLRTVVPDVALTQRFGDVRMTEQLKRINEEFAAKAATLTSERALTKLEANRQATIRDLTAIRDRVRGIYGWSPDPRMRQAARVANVFRNWNMAADLGSSVVNSLNDATNAVFRYGFMNVFGDAYRPFLMGMMGASELPKAARTQAKAMGIGLETAMGQIGHNLGDVVDAYKPGSSFERGLAWVADKSMTINGLGPWTDTMKTIATTAAGAEFLRMAERVAANKATPKELERLAAANVSPGMAARIWREHQASGVAPIDGVPVPNTGSWTDAGARQAFEAAMGREADIMIITPGQEKPLFLSNPLVSLIGQFKGFVAGANERLLVANLQQRDGRTLQGLLASLAMGMLSYRLYTLTSGQQVSDRPQDWIKEGINRSGITGWFGEINNMQAKVFAGKTDAFRLIGADRPLSRYAQRSALSEMLGPTWSRLEGLNGAIGDALTTKADGSTNWNAQDTNKLRRLLIFQNLFYVRRLLDMAEDGINRQIGIQPIDRTPKEWKPH